MTHENKSGEHRSPSRCFALALAVVALAAAAEPTVAAERSRTPRGRSGAAIDWKIFHAPEGAGDCCTANGGTGCSDDTCETLICDNFDSACCTTSWDSGCADAANASCSICGGTLCGGATQNCCQADSGPEPFEHGCSVASCCNLVTTIDSFCGVTQWDTNCRDEAKTMCSGCWQASPGDCCTVHAKAGCAVESCAQIVCAQDDICCGGPGGPGWDANCTAEGGCWDAICAQEAIDLCPGSACPRSLTVTKAGTGTGSIADTVPGGTINCPGDCSQTYDYGTSVTLAEAAALGSAFSAWSGGTCTGSATTCSFSMTQSRTVTGTFNTASNQTLTVTKAGLGTGSITATGINCPGDCSESYLYGTAVTLTATPTGGSVFAAWSGDGTCTGGSTSCGPFGMTQARAVTGTFNPPNQTLNVTIAGAGTGGVTDGAEGDIACSEGNTGTCTDTYPYNTVVTLSATPTGGASFVGWGGEASSCGSTTPCNVTLTEQRDVSATFDALIFADGFGTGDPGTMCNWSSNAGGETCKP